MLSKNTFDFLKNLEKNNNREWFQANKSQYELAKKDFADFVDALIREIAVFDSDLIGTTSSECVFRIFRDVRFSKNKDPYKTNFGAYMAGGGRKSMKPGYYIHVDPNESFMAGGAYMPEPEHLLKIRQNIVANTKEFFEIINNPEFKKVFVEVNSHNDKLVNVPKGFPKDHEAAEYLKYKNYIAARKIDESEFSSVAKLAKHFEILKPLNDFLRKTAK